MTNHEPKHPPADMAGLDGLIEELEAWEWTLRAAYKGGDLGTDEPATLMGQANAQLQTLAARVKVLEAENERLRRDDWFEQFEEQEQLRDNAEQRLSIVEAENERLRGKR